jgi:opacity protein-like surface antigen
MGNNLMFEVGIDKSQHTIDPDYFVYKDLDQYNANFLAKYALINSRIKPIIGAGLSYVYRSYSQNTQSSNNYYNSNLKYDDYAKTHAIDAALYAGAEFSLTDNFSVGASYKYMKNLTSWGNKDYFYQKCSDCQPVESLSNSQFTIDAKLRF